MKSIEQNHLNGFLERSEINLTDEKLTDFILGKTVMITGAGGSIGSELAKQIFSLNPRKLLLIERAEPALFEIDWELKQKKDNGAEVKPVLADINDQTYLERIFQIHRPQIIFHAAAHKHVPLMEENAFEAFRNNTLATEKLIDLAGLHGAETFVFISTDKAIKPISVMGVTKFLAEKLVEQANERFPAEFISVRFGNVLGSAGSVVPIFEKQIRNGGPVTITHPEMTRYFMTRREAVHLVLQAGQMGSGGEVFSLDMGEQVRIEDLAREMIRQSGRNDIGIVYTGIRAGEKLTEEIQGNLSAEFRTGHPKIFVHVNRTGNLPINRLIDDLSGYAGTYDNEYFKIKLKETYLKLFSTSDEFRSYEKLQKAA